MKLHELELHAFGPFSGLTLDFRGEGLHIVYGKNEAGKSTALRAISGLLFGIPRNTQDAHLHKTSDLRIGGLLATSESTLSVVRRKGKENTLLDRSGQPLDEGVLTRWLGGISREQFLSMFGLDHVTLRTGGEAILAGKGHAGESLFAAAMAGGQLHRVLRSLRAEADALFSARSHSRPLNEALKAFSEAQKKTRELSTSPESVLTQLHGLEEVKAEREKCDLEAQRLRLERAQLERALRVLPRRARRRALEERRRALGQVVLLSPDGAVLRMSHERALDAAIDEGKRLERELSDLAERKARLSVPELVMLATEVPGDLAHRLGAHQKEAQELPRIQAEAEKLEAEAKADLRKIGYVDASSGSRRVDAPTQARIRQLALELTRVGQARLDIAHALSQKRARLSVLCDSRARLPHPVDSGPLKKVASRAERDGPLEKRWAELAARTAQLETSARAQLSSLGLGDFTLERAVGLPLPAAESVERFLRRTEELARDEKALLDEASAVQGRVAEIKREIDAIEKSGATPTEEDLAAARAQRDDTFRQLTQHLETPTGAERTARRGQQRLAFDVKPLVQHYREVVRKADEVADRLRRETERASHLSALLAERRRAEQKQRAVSEQARSAAAAVANESEALRALFLPAGVDPGRPSEMRSWLGKHAALARTFEQMEAVRAEAAGVSASIERHKESLLHLLEAHGAPPPASSALEMLLDRASAAVADSEKMASKRSELERDCAEIEIEVAELLSAAAGQERTETELFVAWRAAVAPLGLGDAPSPNEVTVVLDLLTEALHKLDEAEGARRRVAAIEREAQAFDRDVAELVHRHAADLVGIPAHQAAAEIGQRALRAHAALAERRELDRQIEQTRERQARAREQERAARTRLADMMREARVDSLPALELAEQRSEEARRLDAQIAEVEPDLDETALAEGLEAMPLDALALRKEEIDVELDALAQQSSVLHQRSGRYEKGLEELDKSDANAAEAASDAQAALARVRDLAERYARAKVASLVLAREIESYRLVHQGPILARASELFRTLTLGSFVGLLTEYDEEDQPVLCGRREGGAEVRVEGMSDGSRDQLFLALRLATLERHAAAHEPLPIVLDDLLIHFDDDRARSALRVLGDLARHTQVLFFTHHARLVELAEQALSRAELFVHDLGPVRTADEALISMVDRGAKNLTP